MNMKYFCFFEYQAHHDGKFLLEGRVLRFSGKDTMGSMVQMSSIMPVAKENSCSRRGGLDIWLAVFVARVNVRIANQ